MIGLNVGIVLPTILLSITKMMMGRGLSWNTMAMVMTLLTLIAVNPATYLSIAYILEDMPQYATVQKGIFVWTAILPILSLPYYLFMFMWAFCANFECI